MLSIYKNFSTKRDEFYNKNNFYTEQYFYNDEKYVYCNSDNKNIDGMNYIFDNIEDDVFMEKIICI